jgi:hypothetical protein
MKRYIMTMATELDGHAGSTTAFINSENGLTRSEALNLVQQVYGETGRFEEYPKSVEHNSASSYYGDLVSNIGTNEYRTRIAITVMQLPAKLTKNRVYITESRTG